MGKRDDTYELTLDIMADESYYSTRYVQEENEFTGQKEELKRGKGSQRKTHSKLMKRKGVSYSQPKFLKMKIVENGTADEIKNTAKSNVDEQAAIKTDKAKSYPKAFEDFRKLEMFDISMFDLGKTLPWSSKAITNSKNLIKEMHHGVEEKYLQNYLMNFVINTIEDTLVRKSLTDY